MNSTYRRARAEEIPICADVFSISVTELCRVNGLPPPLGYTRSTMEPLFEHLFATGIFEIAEVAGTVAGFAAGVVRENVWFLSMFWVLPEYKLQGIGKPLLERVLRMAEAQGATKFSTWSSIDFAAVGTYLKLGMMPGGPIFTFAGPLLKAPLAHAEVRSSSLDTSVASAIDHIVRGTPRAEDHAFWKARKVPSFQVDVNGRIAGYFYAEKGAIGPAAWLSEEDGPLVVASALTLASSQAETVKLVALGANHTVIAAASAAGLKLISASHLLQSESFGRLDRYVPSGPGLF